MISMGQNQIQIFSSRLKTCPCQAKSEIRTAGPRAGRQVSEPPTCCFFGERFGASGAAIFPVRFPDFSTSWSYKM